MGVTAINQPRTVSITGNQVIYKLSTTNYPTTEGRKAVSVFGLTEVGDIPAVGERLILSYTLNGNTVEAVLTFVDTADDSGLTCAVRTTETLAEYMEDVITPALAAHPLLVDYFNIYHTSSLAVIEALEVGANFNVQIIADAYEYTTAAFSIGEDFSTPEGYDLMYRVKVYDSNVLDEFTLSPWAFITPDKDGRAHIDVGPLLGEIIDVINPLVVTPNPVYRSDYTIRPFVLQMSERYISAGSTGNLQRIITDTDQKSVIRGREPQLLFGEEQFYQSRKMKWLGLQGLVRELLLDTRGTASMLIPPGSGALNMTYTIFTEGGVAEGELDYSGVTLAEDKAQLISVRAGYEHLNLDDVVNTSDVIYYTLQLTRGAQESDVLKLYPVKRKPNHTEVVFRGAHGVAQTILLQGDKNTSIETAYSSYRVARNKPHSVRVPSVIKHSMEGAQNIKLSTGALSIAEAQSLWELSHSTEVYIKDGTTPIAVTLKNKTAVIDKLTRDGNNLLPQLLEFTYDAE